MDRQPDIDDATAQDFFDHFEKYTRPQSQRGKRLLLLDGCESHFTKDTFQKAEVTGEILYPFPPHLTHILQPLDVGIFSAYKHWHQEILQREIADGLRISIKLILYSIYRRFAAKVLINLLLYHHGQKPAFFLIIPRSY
jgi:hypothetical protein